MTQKLSRKQEMLIHSLRQRHGRKDSDLCLCDGLRAGSEILNLRPDLIELVVLRKGFEAKLEFPVEPVILESGDFDRVATCVNSQGILVLAKRPAFVPLTAPVPDPFVLVLDRVGDPGNFGTILRTARAIGLQEVWLTKGGVDPFSDKVLRSASGAQFALNIRMADSIQSLLDGLHYNGIDTIFRTLPAGGENVFQVKDLFEKSAVVFGCEATGVAEIDQSRSLHIPMPGTAESLNVAQAATVILFEYVRRITGN